MNCKKHSVLFICCMLFHICFFLLSSCGYGLSEFLYRADSVDERSKKIRDITSPDYPSSGPLTFILAADVHYGANKPRADDNLLTRLKELSAAGQKPAFVIVLGDIAEHGTKDEFKQYAGFVQKINAMNIPVYGLVGNHDLYNSGWKHWRTHVYPNIPYYRFKTNRFSWYFIDTGNGTLGEPQLKNLVKEMQKDPNPKFVFSHYALYGDRIPYFVLSDPRERAILIDTFSRTNVKMMFSGHFHRGRPVYNYGNFSELVLKGFIDYGTWVEVQVNESDLSFSLTERH